MKLLSIHADFIEFQPLTKAVANAEDVDLSPTRVEDCLVVFIAVEEGDDSSAVTAAATEIQKILAQVKGEKVVLYPWVHLTNKPAKGNEALRRLREVEAAVGETVAVVRAPFGWYKRFTLSCKGHPLSELSREIKSGVSSIPSATAPDTTHVVSASLTREEKLVSSFYVLTPSGELIPHQQFDFSSHPTLEKFFRYEIKKARAYEKDPPHIALMKEHGIASHERGSDAGNLRWYPRGTFMKKQLSAYVSELCRRAGAVEVETPVMYDYEHPALKKYLNRFPARQYVVKSDEKEYFLRFAACFGQFLMAHDFVMSYKQLPLKIYELTRYSFRRDQSGELCGLKRLRAFTMPDMHTLVADMTQAREEFIRQYHLCVDFLAALEIPFEAVFRVLKDFFEENKQFYIDMVQRINKPVMLELFSERYAYFVTKFEFNFIDAMEKASALSTVQIDVENADTYDISYTDREGKLQRPLILHASISGSIERVIYALLEKEAMEIEKGRRAMMPLWLSPTQVRVIAVSPPYYEKAERIRRVLEERGIRADIDDTEESLQKRIRNAEKEWIPYIAIVGEKENEHAIAVRARTRNGPLQHTMSIDALVEEIKTQEKGYPTAPLPLPSRLSLRIKER